MNKVDNYFNYKYYNPVNEYVEKNLLLEKPIPSDNEREKVRSSVTSNEYSIR